MGLWYDPDGHRTHNFPVSEQTLNGLFLKSPVSTLNSVQNLAYAQKPQKAQKKCP